MDAVKTFVLASTVLTVVPFYCGARLIREKKFGLEGYPIYAALYFAAVSVVARWLFGSFGRAETPRRRWLRVATTAVVSAAFVAAYVTCRRSYTFRTAGRWAAHYGMLLAAHLFAFAFIELVHMLFEAKRA